MQELILIDIIYLPHVLKLILLNDGCYLAKKAIEIRSALLSHNRNFPSSYQSYHYSTCIHCFGIQNCKQKIIQIDYNKHIKPMLLPVALFILLYLAKASIPNAELLVTFVEPLVSGVLHIPSI